MGCTRHQVVCTFGGAGGGAAGFQCAKVSLFGQEAAFDLLGGFDNDPYACAAFEYLTGVPQICCDARELTPAMMRDFYGRNAPFAIFGSPPCQGASKLLSTKKSKTAFYEQLNELALINTQLIIDTWPDDLPAFVIYENVPNITSRAKGMIAAIRKLWIAAGCVIQDGFHECRHVGNLAQRRKRWFFVVRNPRKIPAFLYEAPHQPGKVCGDVLNDLPMPGDPAGGGMHVLPGISALNWWRLWAIPAGGDWRDLLPDDGTPRRERFRRHHVEQWTEPSVTIGGSGSNGPCGIADPRGTQTRFHHVDHVTPWDESCGTVTHSPAPSSGAIAIQDPRFRGALGVLDPAEPSGTITTESCPSNGAFAIADGRPLDLGVFKNNPGAFTNKYSVRSAEEPADTVTSASNLGEGAPNYADPRGILAMNLGANAHENLYKMTGADEAVGCITGATRPGNGAASYADPAVARYGFNGTLGILDPASVAPPVTGRAGPTTGPFSYASPVPMQMQAQIGNGGLHYDKYAVRPWDKEALTVHSATRVGSGAQSIAQPLTLALKDSSFHEGPGLGRLGVLQKSDSSSTLTGNARIATGPFSIADDVPRPVPLDLIPTEKCFPKGYGVIDRDAESSNTIAATSFVGCGTYAITDDIPEPLDLTLGCNPHAGAYGVIDDVSPTVIASSTIDNSAAAIADRKPVPPPFVILSYAQAKLVADGYITAPFAIVDPDHPDVALAIVEDMSKPPFRWVETTGKNGKVIRKKEIVPLVLISEDGTWHRPLTTLELAVLQGLPWQHNGAALDFGGGSTEQRKAIGNMVPKPVGEAIAGQMLKAGLASAAGCFFMYSAGGGFWVQPEHRDDLLRSGVRRVRQQDAGKIAPDEMVILDDGARPIRRRTARSKAQVTAADLIKAIIARPPRAPARVSSYQVPLYAEAHVLM